MRKAAFAFVFTALCSMSFLLTACSEVQLASHMMKKIGPNAKTQGTFKVGSPYKINGKYYYPQERYDLVETGIASWYGPQFHGKQTANGEVFDMYELTAAHRTLQMPSLVRVTNLENGRSLVVRVNDRGPYSRGRIIDLSKRSAELLGFKNQGTAKVRLEVLKNESMQIAQAAKSGVNTNGYEVAVNNKRPLPQSSYARAATPSVQTHTTQQVQTAAANNTPQSITAAPVQPQAPQGDYQLANVPSARLSSGEPAVINRTVDMNRVEPLPQRTTSAPALEPVNAEVLDTYIPGHTEGGNFYPDPVITETTVTPTDIFVQAGSFTNYDNAIRLSQKLAVYGESFVKPAVVDERQFYRVRIGPMQSVNAADVVLSQLSDAGNTSAIIIVE